MNIPVSATASMYGDSISDFIGFGTYNQSLYRALGGVLRFSENDALLASGDVFNSRPGWDLAIAGTTVTEITNRFQALVGRDEADVVFVLMGANNYGLDGPGTGTPQDWRDRADDIVAAADAAGKLLVFVPPISHHNDPIIGRETLKAYLPTLASDKVIVPDVSGFDWRIHTNDGVHPNPLGGAFLANAVAQAMAPRLAAGYDFSVTDDPSVNLLDNGDLAGTGGILVGQSLGYTSGVVADHWSLRRLATTGTVTAEKGVADDGRATQIIRFDGKGEVRLTQAIELNGIAGEQYEIAVKVKVTDPNHKFLGFRASDADRADGISLFDMTENPILGSGGTGSYSATLRSSKYTLNGAEQNAVVSLSAFFDTASGASVEIVDVIVRRVAGTPDFGNRTLTGTDLIDTLRADDFGQLVLGLAGDDTLIGGLGADTLDGGGGADMMFGGGGNDTYVVDNIYDKVFETATKVSTDTYDLGGVDTVQSSVTYSIASWIAGRQFIENMTLTGTAAINATGNNLANRLTGNTAANALNGGGGDDRLEGGAGNDRLIGGSGNDLLVGGSGADALAGGSGADTFRFDEAPTTINRDIVSDFLPGVDVIELDRAVFGAFSAAGPLDPAGLAIGTAATTADQHLIYNPRTGILSYDADGAGGLAAIAIARFTTLPAISAADIHLI